MVSVPCGQTQPRPNSADAEAQAAQRGQPEPEQRPADDGDRHFPALSHRLRVAPPLVRGGHDRPRQPAGLRDRGGG